MHKRIAAAVWVTGSAAVLFQCHEAARTHAWYAMDTNVAISLYGHCAVADDTAFARLEQETQRLEALFTDYSDASPLAWMKGNIGDTIQVDPQIYQVLQSSLDMMQSSRGAFDITLHDLKKTWGIGSGLTGVIPDSSVIDSVMRDNPVYKTDWSRDTFPPPLTLLSNHKVILHRRNAALDLGGIAKGFIVDQLHDLLDSLGCPNHIVQAGGDLRVGGHKAASNWTVGIRHPRISDSLSGLILSEQPVAVSTAGDYERFFIQDGVRYHHIFNPHTGRPATGACAVTVMAKTSLEADAIDDALFVLGPEKGFALARKYGVRAVWFEEKPAGICALPMPEFGSALTLKGIPLCEANH